MGGALFSGWRGAGLAPSFLVDPAAPAGLARRVDGVCADIAGVPASFRPAAAILAVKPQMADAILPALGAILPPDCVVLSIMAGKTLARLSAGLAAANPMVRAMPNTPASIGAGMSVACAGPGVTDAQIALCDRLLRAVGGMAWVTDETAMDAVTAVSGSGPAYVFLLAELLESAGIAEGLDPALARLLARKTIFGAGALLEASDEDAAALRRAVTSPKGTTERALNVLMAADAWPAAVPAAVAAAAARARELA
jgi:pyrroline-5-carboxylate reductase